jgi:NADH dehydrogenase [ubiquinone] 1 alpha subcomplex assembly factor 7
MAESNARYYASRDPLGAAGDFVTAPEISQMFGEMIGAWCADLWTRAGSPADVAWVELGPGRGTLARDALRVMRRFGMVPAVHLVEGSPVLRGMQTKMLAGENPVWHDDLATLPDDVPLIVVANEFLDALPIRQLVRTDRGWRERMVGLDGDRFVPIAGDRPMDAAVPAERDAATLIETCPAAAAVVQDISRRLASQGGAALLVDYGYTEPPGLSTLQAVRAHTKVDPFADPGSADLTALVDFTALAEVAQAQGARWLGTVGQGAWLASLGIGARAQALARAAPDRAAEIATALDRLTAPEQMGTLFKVMTLVAPDWPGAGRD